MATRHPFPPAIPPEIPSCARPTPLTRIDSDGILRPVEEVQMAFTKPARILAPAVFVISAGGAQPASGQHALPIESVWSSSNTAPDHPAWRTEDHLWGTGPRVGYERLRALLADPSNDTRTLRDLVAEARQVASRHVQQLILDPARQQPRSDPQTDPAIQCEPPGLIRLVVAPAPLAIDVSAERVVVHHEYWNTVRVIPISGPRGGPPATGTTSRLGSSTARFDGATLIVESLGVPADALPRVTTADGARVVERYTPSDDGARLSLEVLIDDPKTFREPLVLSTSRVRTPGETIIEAPPCELISGQFEP